MPGLGAVVDDDGRRGVQPADQRVEAAGPLGRVDVLGDVQRFVQGEDDREPRRGQAEVPHRGTPRSTVTVVLADDGAQRTTRTRRHRFADHGANCAVERGTGRELRAKWC